MSKSPKGEPKKALKPARFIELDHGVYIRIVEIGNLKTSWNYIYLRGEHNETELIENGEPMTLIENCGCTVLYLDCQWSIKVPVDINEESLIDFTSFPILIRLEYLEGDDDNRKTYGYFKINIISCLNNAILQDGDASKYTYTIELIRYEEEPKGGNIETWPNLPYIKYNIRFEPFFRDYIEFKQCEEVNIAFEYILNAEQEMLEPDKYYLINFLLPINETEKMILVRGSKVQTVKEMFNSIYKSNPNLAHYKGSVRYSDLKINTDLSTKNLFIHPKCNIQDEIDESCKVVAFQMIFRCMLPRETILNLFNHTTLDVFVNISSEPEVIIPHTTLRGAISIEPFKFVNAKVARYALPLTKIIANKYTKLAQVSEKKDNLFNENQEATCLIMELNFPKPLIELRRDHLQYFDETYFNSAVSEMNTQHNDFLDDNFKNEVVEKFLIENRFKDLSNISKLDVNCNNKLMETVAKICFDNFNFDIETEEEATNLSGNIMIHLNDIIFDIDNDHDVKHKSREYRLKNALTCFEFGLYDEAEYFYRMNIHDFSSIQHMCYLDFAIFNLITNQIQMVKVALNKILSTFPFEYSTNFLLGYIALLEKNFRECEKIFKFLTELYPNAVESLIALQFLYILEEKLKLVNKIDEKLDFLDDKVQGRQYLHKQPEVLWIPTCTNDVKMNVVRHFIQIGCFLLAEIGIGFLVHQYGENSFEYNYHMALMCYYRKNYQEALQFLSNIRTGSIERDKRFLIINCLMEMNSKNGIMEYKRFRMKKQKQKCSERIINLLYLKFGRYYLERSKYKTAKYFFKKSCFLTDSYIGFRMLGITAFKLSSFELAESCFNTIYRINPFNKITWEMLTAIFEKKKLDPQYYLCQTLLMEQSK